MMCFNKAGEPIELEEFARLFGDRKYQVVAQDKIASGGMVSTVWLGIDHQFGNGPPLIFETMIFDADQNGGEERRYSTLDEAVTGHAEELAQRTLSLEKVDEREELKGE